MRVTIFLQIAAAAIALAGQMEKSDIPRNSAIARREIFNNPPLRRGGGGGGGDDDDDVDDEELENALFETIEIYGERVEEVVRDIYDSDNPELRYDDPELELCTIALASAYLLAGVTDVDEMTALLMEKNTIWDDARIRTFAQSAIINFRLGGGWGSS